ncbi:MAG: precorrin-2 C(20)-methyltransferase [Planctomycetales bacterium]|nr:precorrin-2 C(20)-methyltransferase [Planctomycetales bacterium]
MSLGILYGVGVGPGAPDLVTLRAANVLRSAPVLALPRSSDHGRSVAWQIAKPTVGEIPGQERLFLTFPMTKEPARLRPYWDLAFGQIGERLERGLSVAFVTEGDPFVYSTFIYLLREVPRRWPGLRVEVVPGVSSITAVPAAAGIPLADGLERVAILPATYGVEDLTEVLRAFDTTVLMKIGSSMPAVVEALESLGLADRAVYVSRATMPEQRIVRDVRAVRAEHGDCLDMLVVFRKDRSGVLAGEPAGTGESRGGRL